MKQNATDPVDHNKSIMIAYLSQGPAKSYNGLKEIFGRVGRSSNTAAFFYHSFDSDCDGCIYQANTALAEGRNIVLKAAANSSLWNNFKYVVFFDDDIQLNDEIMESSTNHHATEATEATEAAWESFHEMLLLNSTDHPLIKPKDNHFDTKDEGTTYQSCVDDNFMAIRLDHVDFIFPFSTIGKENYWLNVQAAWVKMEKCYPAGFRVDCRWSVGNPKHRYEVTEVYTNDERSEVAVLGILETDYPSLGPWKLPTGRLLARWHRCTVKEVPSMGVHPTCKQATEVRFQKWLAGEYQP